MATMLSIAQSVATELGLSPINAVASSQAQDTIQILGLMNASGTELCMEHNWRALDKEYRFTTQNYTSNGTTVLGSPIVTGLASTATLDTTYLVSGSSAPQDCYVLSVDSPTQVTLSQNASATGTYSLVFGKSQYSLPADYDRLVDRTQWDKTKHWEMLGPESAQQWQWLKSGYIATGPRLRWRLLGQYFQIWPLISASEYLGFEYISNGWATSSAGVSKSAFTADDDTCIFPTRVMILFTKMKYMEIKGFDATAVTRDFKRFLDISKAEDAGAATLSFAPKPSQVLVGWSNVPDSGYGT